jgi:hypothetical protein
MARQRRQLYQRCLEAIMVGCESVSEQDAANARSP